MTFPEGYLELGLYLLSGCTALLVLGMLMMKISRNPALCQRAGEATVLATTIYLVLACIPLDLPSRDWIVSAFSASEANFMDRKQPDALRLHENKHSLLDVEPISDAETPNPTSMLSPSHEVTQQGEEKPHKETKTVPSPDPSESIGKLVEHKYELTKRSESNDSPVDLSRNRHGFVAELDAVTPSSLWEWKLILPSIYFLGVALCIGWLLLGRICLLLFLRRTEKPAEEIAELLKSVSSGHFAHAPRLLISRHRSRAFSFGLFRPTIIVPESLCNIEDRNFLRAVLLHEVAHIVRRDALGRLLFNVAFPLLYFHPCYWWIRRKVYFSLELIADDWAANFSTPLKYAEELTSMKRLFSRTVPILFGSNNFFSTRHDFSRRITMLILRKTPLQITLSTSRKFFIYGFFSLILCGLVFTTGVRNVAAEEAASSIDDDPFVAQKKNTTNKPNNPFTTKKDDAIKNYGGPSQSKRANRKTTEADPFKSKRSKPGKQNFLANLVSSTGSSTAGRPIELVQLATQYADAMETIADTSSQLAKIEEINKKYAGTVSSVEIERLGILLRAAKRKQELFYTIANAELKLTSKELEFVKHEDERYVALYKMNIVTRTEVLKLKREFIRLEGRLLVLEAILKLK